LEEWSRHSVLNRGPAVYESRGHVERPGATATAGESRCVSLQPAQVSWETSQMTRGFADYRPRTRSMPARIVSSFAWPIPPRRRPLRSDSPHRALIRPPPSGPNGAESSGRWWGRRGNAASASRAATTCATVYPRRPSDARTKSHPVSPSATASPASSTSRAGPGTRAAIRTAAESAIAASPDSRDRTVDLFALYSTAGRLGEAREEETGDERAPGGGAGPGTRAGPGPFRTGPDYG